MKAREIVRKTLMFPGRCLEKLADRFNAFEEDNEYSSDDCRIEPRFPYALSLLAGMAGKVVGSIAHPLTGYEGKLRYDSWSR